jgi:hypothetical protein
MIKLSSEDARWLGEQMRHLKALTVNEWKRAYNLLSRGSTTPIDHESDAQQQLCPDDLEVLVKSAEAYLAEYGFVQPESRNVRQLTAIRSACAVLGRKSALDE